MLIYNKAYLDNLAIWEKAAEWFKSGLIGEDEYRNIQKKYKSPYIVFHPLGRLGLLILTPLCLFCIVFMSEVILSDIRLGTHDIFLSFFWGIIFYVFAEVSVKSMNHYRTGVRGAILYSSCIALCYGLISLVIGNSLYLSADPLIYFSCILPVIVLAAMRFADVFLSLCSFVCAIIINALLLLKIGTIGKMALPFESMAFSYLFYYLAGRLKLKSTMHYYKDCIIMVETASIVTFYLSGSYLVVRMLTEKLLGVAIGPGEDISLAFFFYAFTILVPLFYVGLGLKRKNHTFFRAGILLEIGGILGIRYYHSLMPPEYALTLSGVIVILLSYFSIRYLRISRKGITFKIHQENVALANIANIVASEIASVHHAPKSDKVEFGGGDDFDGGGAGADY